jgi:hypothetical protein
MDEFYLGKFITDEDVIKEITQYIKDEYIGDEYWYKDKSQRDKFKKEFPGVLQGKDWKIDMILSTTMNRIRNWSSISYMYQAEVENYVIRGVNDQLQCPYCAGMQGKLFAVKRTYARIEESVNGNRDTLLDKFPFAPTALKDDVQSLVLEEGQTKFDAIKGMVKGMSSETLELKGVSAPSYHPRCRDRVVADL